MRIVIAEDDTLLREGLALLLRSEGFDVVAAVDNAEGFLEATRQADAAVVDVRMPPTFTSEGLKAAAEARARRPGFPVLVLSAYVEDRYAGELLAAGADGLGYLLKERVGKVASFIDALNRVAAGGTVMDPEVISQLMSRRRATIRCRRSPHASARCSGSWPRGSTTAPSPGDSSSRRRP